MAFGKENVIVIYREDDDDSLNFATQYKELHDLDSDQLVPLPCSNREVLENYADFLAEVETPLLSALSSSPVTDYSVQCIVVSPYVPGGFQHQNDIVSTTSRLSRVYHTFEKTIQNPLYDRQVFSRFSSEDAELVLMCTRFDAPTISIINDWVKNTIQAKQQLFVTGRFYLDPYSGIGGIEGSRYTEEVELFRDALLPSLGLETVATDEIDPYIDSLIPSVNDDSFYWGWGADRGSLSFFGDSTHIRTFFYNADFDGAYTMRDIDERTWPLMAIRQGYVATAGPMSDPGIDGFLRPRPFMDALFRGATLGEAFLFSQPYLDWTMACFGDPLLTFSFPETADTLDLLSEDNAWQLMAIKLAQSMIRLYRKTNRIKELRDDIVLGDDTETSVDLAYPMEELYKAFQQNGWKNDYVNLTNSMISFALTRNRHRFRAYHPNLNDYLNQTENRVTNIFLDSTLNSVLVNSISDSNIEDEGMWSFEASLERLSSEYVYYHFELDVSSDQEFVDIVLEKKSYEDINGWYFQDYDGTFKPISIDGVGSNFVDKKVAYIAQNTDTADERLEKGEYYYIRFRQYYQGVFGDYRYFTLIVYS